MKKMAVAALSLLMLAACGSDETDETMTVGLTYIPDVQFFPFYVAVDRGYFEDAGVTVGLRHHGTQEALFTALATGQEDVVFTSGDEVMSGRDEGVDLVSIATLYSDYPATLIVPADSPITSPEDLEGKTVGIPGEFGATYFGLLAMIDHYDLDNVDVQSIGYTQMAALSRGDVDAVVGFINNDAVAMQSQGFDVRTIDLAPEVPLVGPGLAVMTDNLDGNEEQYAGLLEGLDRAVTFAEENPEEALDIVSNYVTNMKDPEVWEAARATFEATLPLYSGHGTVGFQDRDRWEAMNEFMVQAGLITAPIDIDEAMFEIER
ncbi:ABC transporter substrate-binding protein [Flaviflexus massiliensis]|uniref:ABC transporter substrate-binding protein n=1 Tax=Flaviflexus massiliensis TaxID=1522309 RepID=UPI0006D53CC9|nr:ABC transporter substrate-binding protein [Flaviflexus massiliensis]